MFTLIEFILNLKLDVVTVLASKMRVEIREQNINIPDKASFLGLVIIPVKQDTGVVLNISALYEKLQSGTPYEMIVAEALKSVDQQFRKNMENYCALFIKYEQIRSRLVIQVVDTEKNRDILQYIPHTEKGNKSVIYRIILDEKDDKVSSIVVTNRLLKTYQVHKELLHVDALVSSLSRSRKNISHPKSVLDRLRHNQEQIQNESLATKNNEVSRGDCLWKN